MPAPAAAGLIFGYRKKHTAAPQVISPGALFMNKVYFTLHLLTLQCCYTSFLQVLEMYNIEAHLFFQCLLLHDGILMHIFIQFPVFCHAMIELRTMGRNVKVSVGTMYQCGLRHAVRLFTATAYSLEGAAATLTAAAPPVSVPVDPVKAAAVATAASSGIEAQQQRRGHPAKEAQQHDQAAPAELVLACATT